MSLPICIIIKCQDHNTICLYFLDQKWIALILHMYQFGYFIKELKFMGMMGHLLLVNLLILNEEMRKDLLCHIRLRLLGRHSKYHCV